jgi:hypothetical protein
MESLTLSVECFLLFDRIDARRLYFINIWNAPRSPASLSSLVRLPMILTRGREFPGEGSRDEALAINLHVIPGDGSERCYVLCV